MTIDKHAEFLELINRLRQGDEQAAYQLVQSYESVIRIAIRARLRDPVYNRVFDSMDICQSVMASFFPRAVLGQYHFDEPKQLVNLLIRMAQSKLSNQVRRHRAQRRDVKRDISHDDSRAEEVVDGKAPASQIIQARELLASIKHLLTPEEQLMVDMRRKGFRWDEIAEKLGGTPEARRKQFQRFMEVISKELKLDDDDKTTSSGNEKRDSLRESDNNSKKSNPDTSP